VSRIRLVGRARGGRCVFCHDSLQGEVERCPECRAAWHDDCRPTDGHCHTLGCTAPAPQPAGRRRGLQRAVEPPTSTRHARPAPAWTTSRRRPGWLARFGPYSRLVMSGLVHASLGLGLLVALVAAITHPHAVWDTLVNPKAEDPIPPPLAFLLALGGVASALAAMAYSGLWLRRLPGVLAELHELLDETTPVLMDLTVEKEQDDETVTWWVRLEARRGEHAGHPLRLKVGGLLPPWWLTSFERAREPVLVYGLPPPGPYVIEFESGALALLHPD
jgi:hypothetical protein